MEEPLPLFVPSVPCPDCLAEPDATGANYRCGWEAEMLLAGQEEAGTRPPDCKAREEIPF